MPRVERAVPGVDHDKVAVVLNGGKKDGTGMNEVRLLAPNSMVVAPKAVSFCSYDVQAHIPPIKACQTSRVVGSLGEPYITPSSPL